MRWQEFKISWPSSVLGGSNCDVKILPHKQELSNTQSKVEAEKSAVAKTEDRRVKQVGRTYETYQSLYIMFLNMVPFFAIPQSAWHAAFLCFSYLWQAHVVHFSFHLNPWRLERVKLKVMGCTDDLTLVSTKKGPRAPHRNITQGIWQAKTFSWLSAHCWSHTETAIQAPSRRNQQHEVAVQPGPQRKGPCILLPLVALKYGLHFWQLVHIYISNYI